MRFRLSIPIITEKKYNLPAKSTSFKIIITWLLLAMCSGCISEDDYEDENYIFNEDRLSSVFVRSNGQIITGGTSSYADNQTQRIDRIVLIGFNSDGSLDSGFGLEGIEVVDAAVGHDEIHSLIPVENNGFLGLVTATKYGSESYTILRFQSNGEMDNSFGSGGKTLAANGNIVSMALNLNHEIVVGGSTTHLQSGSNNDFLLSKYNWDGSRDYNFHSSGSVKIDFDYLTDIGVDIAVQADDKILIGGYLINYYPAFDFSMARINSDGSPDCLFGENGKIIVDINNSADHLRCITLQPDGKILMAGRTSNKVFMEDIAVVRLNEDGSPDENFGEEGIAIVDIMDSSDDCCEIFALENGQILIAGGCNVVDLSGEETEVWNFACMRLNENGSIDNAFGINGRAVMDVDGDSDFAYAAALQSDGKIVLVGETRRILSSEYTNTDFVILRYNEDGSIDNSFGDNGIITRDFFGGE